MNILIITVFSGGSYDKSNPDYGYLVDNGHNENWTPTVEGASSMYGIATTLLLIVLVLVPFMLLAKPVLFKISHGGAHHTQEIEFRQIQQVDEEHRAGAGINRGGSEGDEGMGYIDQARDQKNKTFESIQKTLEILRGPKEEHTFGEIFIHQMIETIEFVLGTVSNTASYLRLWALSLAHSQLTEVFFNLSIQAIFPMQSTIKTIFAGIVYWPVFWSVNFAVLMMMDTLECTLHTLRLHWVEFQNKFFKGNGYAFKPLNFKVILLQVLGRS